MELKIRRKIRFILILCLIVLGVSNIQKYAAGGRMTISKKADCVVEAGFIVSADEWSANVAIALEAADHSSRLFPHVTHDYHLA